MPVKYPNLFSPVKIGNVVLRNRLIATCSSPHFCQGSESWPTEGFITHYANKAKGGAAVVTCKGASPVLNGSDPHASMLDIHNRIFLIYILSVGRRQIDITFLYVIILC